MRFVMVVATVGGVAGQGRAGFSDGSFESGTFSAYTTTGNPSVVGVNGPVIPTDGTLQARLVTGGATPAAIETLLGLSSGSINSLGRGNATDGSAIAQVITAAAGDILTFQWNFATNEFVNAIYDVSFFSVVPTSGPQFL